MYFLLFFFAFSVISPSLQITPNEGKQQIEEYRADTENRLRTALGKVSGTVLRTPLRQLRELETAGKDDVDTIAKFQGSGDKDSAIQKSVLFWSKKMDEAIQRYVENPGRYRGLVIDFIIIPEDPHWNDTQEYKKIEKELNSLAQEAISKVEDEFQKRAVPAKQLSDITETSWKKLEAKRALDDAVFGITMNRQFIKRSAASGEASEEVLVKRMKDAISDAANEFNSKLQTIYK